MASFGWAVETPAFDCVDWTHKGADLSADVASFTVFPSPYALGCDVRAPLVVVSTVEELEAADLSGKVVLLRGDIAKEQIMPKNFPFYNPDEHKHIIGLLESKRPLAIVAATSRNPELAGALYPFPMFEDGDFDIPSVYMTDEEGSRLAGHAGEIVSLRSRAERIPSAAFSVVARRGDPSRRIVLMAHIDAKIGTPGAMDNATGVALLLLLAEMLVESDGGLGIELVPVNGEDYYASSGEKLWLTANAGRLGEIVLGINMDGLGHRGGRSAYSLYGCPPDVERAIREVFAAYPGMAEGQPWYQGDHSMLLQNGVPALALTSEQMTSLWQEVAHTADDTPEIVDPAKLAEVALALRDLIVRLSHSQAAVHK